MDRRKSTFDYNLFFLMVFTIGFGLMILYSATAFSSSMIDGAPTDALKSQLKFTIVGCVGMLFFIVTGVKWLRKISFLAYLGSMFTVLLLLTPLVNEGGNAGRWIKIGSFGFQPAELVKIGVIIVVADLIARYGKRIVERRSCIVIGVIVGLAFLAILIISSNLSSAIIIGAIGILMLYVAYPNYKWFLISAFAGIVFVVVFVLWISPALYELTGNYQLARIEVWKDMDAFKDSGAYQPLKALYAIGSGGPFGKGLGKSAQKLIIPEVQNDMIFAVICEELGLFGGVSVLLLFLLMIYRMVIIAKNADDLFSGMVVVGVTIHIAMQVICNTAVVTGLFPNTGVTLPFFSSGGSATVCILAEMGMVLAVSRNSKKVE